MARARRVEKCSPANSSGSMSANFVTVFRIPESVPNAPALCAFISRSWCNTICSRSYDVRHGNASESTSPPQYSGAL